MTNIDNDNFIEILRGDNMHIKKKYKLSVFCEQTQKCLCGRLKNKCFSCGRHFTSSDSCKNSKCICGQLKNCSCGRHWKKCECDQ